MFQNWMRLTRDAVLLGVETQRVMGLRLIKLSRGGRAAEAEAVRMVEEKHRLIEILTKYIDAAGLTVVIGSENVLPDLHPFSVVASTFRDGERSGTVGVIGPTRMRYHRAISAVDRVSQTMTRVLDQTDESRRS